MGNPGQQRMVNSTERVNCPMILPLLTFDILHPLALTCAIKSNPMTTTPFRRVLTSALTVVVLAFAFAACNKEKPTTAIITVKDADGHPVDSAYVKLYANPAIPRAELSRLLKEGMTNAGGRVEFDYTGLFEQGQAGFAVMDILTFKDSSYAEGIIKILEEETNEETLVMQPIPPQ